MPSAQYLPTFHLYCAYGAHVPFLCTSTYGTGDINFAVGYQNVKKKEAPWIIIIACVIIVNVAYVDRYRVVSASFSPPPWELWPACRWSCWWWPARWSERRKRRRVRVVIVLFHYYFLLHLPDFTFCVCRQFADIIFLLLQNKYN